MNSNSLAESIEAAEKTRRAGNWPEAERILREALALHPNHPALLQSLCAIFHQTGRLGECTDVLRQMIQLEPARADLHNNLGIVLCQQHDMAGAISAFRRAASIQPDYLEAQVRLGDALLDAGEVDESIEVYRRASRIDPSDVSILCNLAVALKKKGGTPEAIAHYQRAADLQPNNAIIFFNLGIALADAGKLQEALSSYRRAISLRPAFCEARNNLAGVLEALGRLDDALVELQEVLRLRPDYADAYANLASVQLLRGHLDNSVAAGRRAVELRPDLATAHNALGNALKDLARLDEAIAAYRQILRIDPCYTIAHSNLLYTLLFQPQLNAVGILKEHRRWNAVHADPLKNSIKPHSNNRNPDRPLRIGYVSPDFRDHPVGRFLLPVVAAHDKQQFSIVCYSGVAAPDNLTRAFTQHAACWRPTVGMTDENLAQVIRHDQIDILFDLSMHMAGTRLLVFARRPAPLQVTWLAYPGTTGMDAIDYRITDPQLDPPGVADDVYSETSLPLPNSFWCLDRADLCSPNIPAVNELPALAAGRVTFGSLNNFCKMNQPLLELWKRVLDGVPGARIRLLAPEGSARDWVRTTLGDRVDFVPKSNRLDYLRYFHQIDISLDPLPYNGHTTTFDSLWMGVPVITLPGATVVGRAGVSTLTNVGLPELIAETPHCYVDLARQLAADLPRLQSLRHTLRGRMLQSPVMDADSFTRHLESACRQIWRKWCSKTAE